MNGGTADNTLKERAVAKDTGRGGRGGKLTKKKERSRTINVGEKSVSAN